MRERRTKLDPVIDGMSKRKKVINRGIMTIVSKDWSDFCMGSDP